MPVNSQAAPCAVAIGASAGGVQALRTIIAALPVDLRAAVFVVLHLDPNGRSLLPTLLAATTSLRVRDVRDEGLVESGTIYVAVGVVLTGNGSDGASGIAAIKHAGGRTIVQDPADARFSSMPRAATATGLVDSVLPLVAIGRAVARAVAEATASRAA